MAMLPVDSIRALLAEIPRWSDRGRDPMNVAPSAAPPENPLVPVQNGPINALGPQTPGQPVPYDMTTQYNTILSPQEEADYQKEHAPGDSYDYDMRGAFKQGITAAGNGHFPDTFKKPNHPTFSDESKYHGVNDFKGGHWGQDASGKDMFTPGPTNMELHGASGLQQYFKQVEPDVTLALPPQNALAR